AMAVDPSGSFLLAGSQKGWIYCWELSTGELLNTFQAHFKAVTRICVAALGSLCLSASEDGSARVWEMHRSKSTNVSTMQGHSRAVTSLCFSADGGVLVSASVDGTVRVW
ncbi:WD40-repeat-containing domain protein, partial [Ochromonadaceae sp. CCMP2298]